MTPRIGNLVSGAIIAYHSSLRCRVAQTLVSSLAASTSLLVQRLGTCAADIGTDQADRNAKRSLQVAAEVIADRRKGRDRCRTRHQPMIGVGRWPGDAHAIDGEQSQLVVVCRRDGRAGSREFSQRPFHIRLPATDPNVADQNILPLDLRIALGDGERGRLAAGRQWCKFYLPSAVGRCGRCVLPGEADGHLFTLGGGSPDRHFHVALQDGVVREQDTRLDLLRSRAEPGRKPTAANSIAEARRRSIIVSLVKRHAGRATISCLW